MVTKIEMEQDRKTTKQNSISNVTKRRANIVGALVSSARLTRYDLIYRLKQGEG